MLVTPFVFITTAWTHCFFQAEKPPFYSKWNGYYASFTDEDTCPGFPFGQQSQGSNLGSVVPGTYAEHYDAAIPLAHYSYFSASTSIFLQSGVSLYVLCVIFSL